MPHLSTFANRTHSIDVTVLHGCEKHGAPAAGRGAEGRASIQESRTGQCISTLGSQVHGGLP